MYSGMGGNEDKNKLIITPNRNANHVNSNVFTQYYSIWREFLCSITMDMNKYSVQDTV